MRKNTIILLLAVAAVLFSCGGKKHDAAYYEQLVDSIRRAEQVKSVLRKAGLDRDPVNQFFDTLRLHSLPVRSEGSQWDYLGRFSRVPKVVNSWLGYTDDAELVALRLPSAYRHPVLMLGERIDTANTTLFLCTLDAERKIIDELCLNEEMDEERLDDYGRLYTEYFITSDYEITLLHYYRSHYNAKPRLDHMRRYIIDAKGHFEETIIPIE